MELEPDGIIPPDDDPVLGRDPVVEGVEDASESSAGGAGGGSLKITVANQAPRVIGFVRTGPEVIVITAAFIASRSAPTDL